jgi:hypothetical protein
MSSPAIADNIPVGAMTECDEMPIPTIDPADMEPGDRFLYLHRDVTIVVVVLRERDECTDRFGRAQWRYWCRREDSGAEGFMRFGPGARLLWRADRPIQSEVQ